MWGCGHKFKKRKVKICAEIRHYKIIRTENTSHFDTEKKANRNIYRYILNKEEY